MKQTTALIKAVADTTRLRIIALLRDKGELCVCDLMAALELPQSTISRHLSTLRTAGWVEDRRSGMWMYYRIHPHLADIQQRLLSTLAPHLTETATFAEDAARLATFTAGKNCI